MPAFHAYDHRWVALTPRALSYSAKRSPAFGALIASLPIVSVLAVALYQRSRAYSPTHARDVLVRAEVAANVLGDAVPIRTGYGFWTTQAVPCALTVLLYILTVWVPSKFGISL